MDPTALKRVIERAVERIVAYGLDGPRPIEEIEAIHASGEQAGQALSTMIESCDPARLAAAFHLVQILRAHEAVPILAQVAFETEAPMAAKREAAEALARLDACPDKIANEWLGIADSFLRAPTERGLQTVLEGPAAWKVPIVEDWLEGARSEETRLVGAALGHDPALDLQLLEWLGRHPTPAALDIVRVYASKVGDRDRNKAAKRALHRLRSQGVETEDAKEGGGFSLEICPDVRAEARAYHSGIDGRGSKLVWWLTPSRRGGYRVLEAVVQEEGGIARAEVITVTRKGFRKHMDRLQENPEILVAQVDPDHAAAMLVRAEEIEDEQELPAAYREWRRGDGQLLMDGADASVLDRSRIYQQIDEATVADRPDLIEESVELFKSPWFSSWAYFGISAKHAAQRVRNAETSNLVINDEQRKDEIQGALRSVVDDVEESLRTTMRRRLESMAMLLWEHGYRAEAEQSLAAAVGFTSVSLLYDDHPFACAFFQRGVWVAYRLIAESEQPETGGGRIIQA